MFVLFSGARGVGVRAEFEQHDVTPATVDVDGGTEGGCERVIVWEACLFAVISAHCELTGHHSSSGRAHLWGIP